MDCSPVSDDCWMLLRPLELPSACSGSLFLMGMPGHHRADGAPEEAYGHLQRNGVDFLVNLAGLREMEVRSAAYAEDWKRGRVPVGEMLHFPLDEYAVPSDMGSFARLAHKLATRLKRGGSVAVHCANGMGRTGLMAAAVLMAMGLGADGARACVRRAGSGAESQVQRKFLAGLEGLLARGGGCGAVSV